MLKENAFQVEVICQTPCRPPSTNSAPPQNDQLLPSREATNSGGLVRHKSKQVVTELTPVCWGQAGREELVAREEVAWELSYQTLTTWQKQTIAKNCNKLQ